MGDGRRAESLAKPTKVTMFCTTRMARNVYTEKQVLNSFRRPPGSFGRPSSSGFDLDKHRLVEPGLLWGRSRWKRMGRIESS